MWACLSQRSDAWIGSSPRGEGRWEGGDACGRPGALAPTSACRYETCDARRLQLVASHSAAPNRRRPSSGPSPRLTPPARTGYQVHADAAQALAGREGRCDAGTGKSLTAAISRRGYVSLEADSREQTRPGILGTPPPQRSEPRGFPTEPGLDAVEPSETPRIETSRYSGVGWRVAN